MNASQWLPLHESFEAFIPSANSRNARARFPPSPRCRNRPRCCGSVYTGPVDDPKGTPPAAFDRGLHQTARAACNEGQRLDDRPFAAAFGQLAPPRRGGRLARGLSQVESGGSWTLQKDPASIEVGVPENLRQLIERQIERLGRRRAARSGRRQRRRHGVLVGGDCCGSRRTHRVGGGAM